jgi:exodeoxyribonuclease V alpha subunit
MIEQKIKFTVVRIKCEDEIRNICRAVVRIEEGAVLKNVDAISEYTELALNKRYEAVITDDSKANVLKVKEIAEIYCVDTFVNESLVNDKKISSSDRDIILKRIGNKTVETIIKDIEILINQNELSEDKGKYIVNKAKMYMELIEVRLYCRHNGIKNTFADQIYKKLGIKAIEVIKNNPYELYNFDVNYKRIDELAFKLGLFFDNKERVMSWILEYLRHSSEVNGHVFVLKNELIEELSEFMNKFGSYHVKHKITHDIIKGAIADLEAEGKVIVSVHDNNEICVYLKELYDVETGVANIVSGMVLEKIKIDKELMSKVNDFIKSYADGEFKLTRQQAQAVKNAITERISVLSGFPGTGKTKTVTAIVKCISTVYKEAKIEVVGYTGRAVSRLNETLPKGIEAKTIHRLLGIGNDGKVTAKCVTYDFLIIDEATLVSMELVYLLLQHIHKDTRVVFVGDKDQIGMGVGQVFCDLISYKEVKSVQLSKIFRQEEGSILLNNIQKMANGIGFKDKSGLKYKKGEFELIEAKNENEIQNKIQEAINNVIKEGKTLKDIQVLSPIKEGKCGTKKINKLIQEKFNPNPKRIIHNLVVGDRIMQSINNYERAVFNGESGLIISSEELDKNRKVTVRFGEGKLVEYSNEDIKEIEPSYAITIHKSQGSQFPIVILPVLKEHKLNLNLIYTACSRAEKEIVLIGEKDVFDMAIKNLQIKRNSNLIELIEAKVKGDLGRIA